MDVLEKELVQQMRDICRLIAKGDYSRVKALEELSIEENYPKVITDLAESFSLMLIKLETREHQLEGAIEKLEKAEALLKKRNKTLKKQIYTLEIDIDKMKKSQEVSKITETAFFKEIKRKSKKMREE